MKLGPDTRLIDETQDAAVGKALEDLRADLARCIISGGEGQVTVALAPALTEAERYSIDIAANGIRVRAADRLGAVYGLYRISRELLGVDPFWFWKDQDLPMREAFDVEPQTLVSTAPTFRLRGWFVNDEDLLTEWKNGGGARDIRYPYYSQVVHPDVIERVCETCLRAGCNLIIPASFVDVMNPAEARLVQIAVARGLYVTQHHIEPLGVSHFGFENYWRDKGEPCEFSYSGEPERVIETWRAYAKKWYELAGEQVIWQLGLRGKGDRAVWVHDKGITEKTAGAFVTHAFQQQWEIVCETDPRETPPATTTLWWEMSNLMSRGTLTIPEPVTVIFTNNGTTQVMQDDFHNSPRENGRAYGAYLHVAFWGLGPHLAQGTDLDKFRRVVGEVVQKGDTDYAILNVANIRETALGVAAFCAMTQDYDAFDPADFRTRWAGPVAGEWYKRFADALPHRGDLIVQDGYIRATAHTILESMEHDRELHLALIDHGYAADMNELREMFAQSADAFASLLNDLNATAYPAETRRFHDFSLRIQGHLVRRMLLACIALIDGDVHEAARQAEQLIAERRDAEYGKWQHWYRGDKKENWPSLLERLEKLSLQHAYSAKS